MTIANIEGAGTTAPATSRQPRNAIGVAPFSPHDRVRVLFTDGTVVEGEPISAAAGSRHKPPSQAQARTKFIDTAGLALNHQGAERLFGRLWNLSPETKIASILDDAVLT
jgi:hypothetical protein